MQTLAYSHLCPEDNPAGAAGIDFKGRKDLGVLDCFQHYGAMLLDPQPIHSASNPSEEAGVLRTVLTAANCPLRNDRGLSRSFSTC